MYTNLALCENCGGKIVLTLGEHTERVSGGIRLLFCSEGCADSFVQEERPFPLGLAHDLGLEEGGY